MSSSQLVPCSQEDYLDTDPSLRGQNYVCMSFLSPEDVIVQKEHFFFEKFIENFTTEMKELFDGLSTRYPKDVDNLRMLKERYSYLFQSSLIGEEYNYFVSNSGDSLQKTFDEKNNFKTSVRGIKVRGVFDTIREAQVRAEVLKKLDGKFNVYVAEVGAWCPWSPNPEDIQQQEFAETQLNTLMKHYKDNQVKKDVFYEERKRELQFMKVKKELEADTWADSKMNDVEASTSGVSETVQEESVLLEPTPSAVVEEIVSVETAADEVVVSETVSEIIANVVADSTSVPETEEVQQA
jgi:hypothetical protein